jgi:hypothetical protein
MAQRIEGSKEPLITVGLLVFSEQGAEGTIGCIQCLPDESKNRRFEGTPDYSGLLVVSEQGGGHDGCCKDVQLMHIGGKYVVEIYM